MARYDMWARIYVPVHRGWCMTSNLAENINSALVSVHELPIYDFLEEGHLMFGRWNCDNKKEATYTFTPLICKFQQILVKNEVKSTKMTVIIVLCISIKFIQCCILYIKFFLLYVLIGCIVNYPRTKC